ncbi:hypothetical protein EJD97_019784 [Solanum chilense]|uniref:Uncharacterized protein n=1 Tax=Solanum chilense TaxID=4083 RepID=A0A6N2B120_SOLCI|nr:hypothetical protein EJD97_019784 [Solanum chilense]
MELAGATTIKRDRVINELVVFLWYWCWCGAGVGAGARQDQGATSCRRRCGFLYEKWKKQNEDSIMRETYSDYYDPTNRILDLNFYTNFLKRYKELSDDATTIGGRNIKQLVDEFEWDEDMIDYVRGIRPYPGGMNWIGAKRILTVMNMNNIHFVTLEIILHDGHMNAYKCQLKGMEHTKFLTYIQSVFKLLPKFLM